MPHVVFAGPDGPVRTIEGSVGQSVMEVARRSGVAGIIGECGGCCACGTCHVLVAPEWRAMVGEPGCDEAELLDMVGGRRAGSRLSCQIRLRAVLDGLSVVVPAPQG